VRLGGHNAVEAAGRLPGRTQKEPEGGMASLKRVQNFISDAFSFVNQEPGRTPVLVMDALDETGDVAGTAIQKTATRCPHLVLQPLPAGKPPTLSKPLKTGKKLVGHPPPGCRHVHEPRSGEIVQGPQSRDRKDDGSLATVVGAGGCGRLTAFVAQKDSGLPVVKVGEADPAGEFRMETSLGTLGS
jgi:hypothetical protein